MPEKSIKLPEIIQKEIDGSHYYWVDGVFMPSVTHILGVAAPTGEGLKNFFLKNTQESAAQILEESGEFGTLIHKTIERLLQGDKVNLEEKNERGKFIFTDRHKRYLMDFQHWFAEYKPEVIATELMVASREYMYAGTLDFICKIGDKVAMVDWKTSSAIHYNYELQITAYKKAYEELHDIKIDETYVLRLGAKTKIGYEYKPIKREFSEFLNVYNTFISINGGKLPQPPTVKVYPSVLSLYEEIPV